MLYRRDLFQLMGGAAVLPSWSPRDAGMTATLTDTALVLDAARTGTRLEPREYWIEPPLILRDGGYLHGVPGQTTIRALPIVRPYAVPLLYLGNTFPQQVTTEWAGFPIRTIVEDIRLVGSGPDTGLEYGVMIDGAHMRLTRVDVTNCYYGILHYTSVDVVVRDSLLAKNNVNVMFDGPKNSNTTTFYHGCNIREARWDGVMALTSLGCGLLNCIVESNAGVGLRSTENTAAYGSRTFLVRDCWFENNGGGAMAAVYPTLRVEGLTVGKG